MSSFTVVIPARFPSTRLPGKPLLDIGGKPMIRHVWERALESGAVRVVIATDDARVEAACREFGADAVMTSDQHDSGTDRINEVAGQLHLGDNDIIVNVQGDEPFMPPQNIQQVAELAAIDGTDISTLHVPIAQIEEYLDTNTVKLVADEVGRALYFSRAPLPWHRDAPLDASGRPTTFSGAVRHLGIYAYRVSALRAFSSARPCVLETTEKLEQLRALWLGMTIRTAIAHSAPSRGVDTSEDLEVVRAIYAQQDR